MILSHTGHRSSQDIRGCYIALVTPYGLADICWKVVGQTALSDPNRTERGQGRTLRHGNVTLESVANKVRHSVSFLEVEQGIDDNLLRIVETN